MQTLRRGADSRNLWAAAAVLVAGSVLALPGQAQTQDIATRGRDVATKYSDAVVTVKLAVKVRMSMEGKEQEEENSSEITATVIDPSGLAVCALSEADPTNAVGQMMGDQEGFKFEMDITDVKMRLADGTELPAKVVLRDKDLDLAFVRLIDPPAKPLAAVDLSGAAPTDVLEEVIILNRMGEVANRVPATMVDRIVGVIKKPRLMYIPGPIGQYSSLGWMGGYENLDRTRRLSPSEN